MTATDDWSKNFFPASFDFHLVKTPAFIHNLDVVKQKTSRNSGSILPESMSVKAKANPGEDPEIAEQAKLVPELSKSDQDERSSWKLDTDRSAFGREKISIPERWD